MIIRDRISIAAGVGPDRKRNHPKQAAQTVAGNAGKERMADSCRTGNPDKAARYCTEHVANHNHLKCRPLG